MVRLAMQAHVAEATTEVYKPSASIGLESIAFRSDTGHVESLIDDSSVPCDTVAIVVVSSPPFYCEYQV